MTLATDVELPLLADDSVVVGTLTIECLPRQLDWNGQPALRDDRATLGRDPVTAPVQLLEDVEYAYAVSGTDGPVSLEPVEAFDPSDETGRTGRLRPGRSVGTIGVEAVVGEAVGRCELEVRSRKLDYLSEYRWMLQRLADEAADLVMQRFAAAGAAAFRPDPTADPQTLYQRFAFVSALVRDPQFQGSLQQVLRRPHHAYLEETSDVHPSQGIRAGRNLAKLVAAGGRRVELPESRRIGGLASIPEVMVRTTHRETFDTVPNRFVRFALTAFRDLAEAVAAAMARESSPAAARGRREAELLAEEMDLVLGQSVLVEVAELSAFPADNQVLQRREGYRDIYRGFLQAEVAAALTWEGGSDVFAAGLRDVATLYEYWTFVELARIVGDLPGFDLDRRPLLSVTSAGMALELRRGAATILTGSGQRRDRTVNLELCFNRTFRRPARSWTETMRPDISLRITPDPALTIEPETWVHFDAKYRVASANDVFDGEGDDYRAAKSDDLLKMHAYRDAIRRTAGAYVLYPGGDEDPRRHEQYHEVLPGLGAFAMRPTESGTASAATEHALQAFIADVIDHVAAGGTSHERAGYWTDRAYGEPGDRLAFQPLDRPAADTLVLLGYVKSDAHLAWIERERLYNLRADGRSGSVGLESPELGARLLLLYHPTWSDPRLFELTGQLSLGSRSDLTASGYPEPRGDRYLCLRVGEEISPAQQVPISEVVSLTREERDRAAWAAPRAVAWSDLMAVGPLID